MRLSEVERPGILRFLEDFIFMTDFDFGKPLNT